MKAAIAAAALVLAASFVAARFDPEYMLCLVNKERGRRGLDNLGYSGRLEDAAQGHSDYQARKRRMGHSGSGGSDPADRISDAGFDWKEVGENVAYGYEDEEECMKMWMKSPGHKKNILSSRFTHFGAAVAFSRDDQPYYTQDFAGDGRKHRDFPTCPGRSSGSYGSGGDYGSYGNDDYGSYGSDEYDSRSYGSEDYGSYYDDEDSYYDDEDSYYDDEDSYGSYYDDEDSYGSYYDDEDSYYGSYYDDEDSYYDSDSYYGSEYSSEYEDW